MKIAVIIIRTLMGLLFLVSAINYFFPFMPMPEMSDGANTFLAGMIASKYVLPLVKGLEVIVAVALISGRFVPLAAVVIFPIVVNIVLFHAILAPEGLATPLFLLAGNLFLAYRYRKHYETLIVANA
jgi:putative oxidoreductase